MARGNRILVAGNPKGVFAEGVIAAGQTPKPGQILQRDPTVALQGGRPTLKLYDRDASSDRPAGALWVLLEDILQGKTTADAYAAGDRCLVYSPLGGEEINLLLENQAGTADDIVAGDLLQVKDGTGKVIKSTNAAPWSGAASPEIEPAMALEAVTDPTADTLLWCEWSAY